jgi:SSS family solute:Na+ symporter
VLAEFYARVRPAGPGWERIRRESGLGGSPDSMPLALAGWVLGLASVYGALFATGGFVYGRPVQGAVWSAVAAIAVAGLLGIGRQLWRPSAGPAPVKG